MANTHTLSLKLRGRTSWERRAYILTVSIANDKSGHENQTSHWLFFLVIYLQLKRIRTRYFSKEGRILTWKVADRGLFNNFYSDIILFQNWKSNRTYLLWIIWTSAACHDSIVFRPVAFVFNKARAISKRLWSRACFCRDGAQEPRRSR